MPATISRQLVESFHDALASGDASRIAAFVADDVDWLLVGPVDFMHFCGQRRTRAEVFELFHRLIPEVLDVAAYDHEYVLIDQDRVASLARFTATQRSTGRIISYRFATFMRFRDDRIVEYRTVTDTLDAVEQMLGRHVDLSAA
ncbi:MAG: nuclear transport factor 2 family protein [Xanthobacteraceae bacterium]|jgi:ketosteroid isomerase-like protein